MRTLMNRKAERPMGARHLGWTIGLLSLLASSAAADDQEYSTVRVWGTPYYELEPCIQGDAVQLSMGVLHSAVVLQDGSVQCWGLNYAGQCDVPAWIGPDADQGQIRAAWISAGEGHPAAVLEDGSVHCWGENEFGECNVPPHVGTPSNPARWVSASIITPRP